METPKNDFRYSLHLDNVDANDEHECLSHCKEKPDCTWFTFYPNSLNCQLLASCIYETNEFVNSLITGSTGGFFISVRHETNFFSGTMLPNYLKFYALV